MPKRVWTLVVLVAALAGCSDSASGDGSPQLPAAAGGSGPMTTVTVDVSGEVTAKGTAKALPATYSGVDYKSCAGYGKGESDNGQQYFVLPRDLRDPIAGKRVSIGAEVEQYRGPGGYPIGRLTDQGSPAGISFDGKLYFLGSGATSTTTVTADGGGKWVFGGLAVQNADNTESPGKLSGSVTWTCSDKG
jgi:hypothetical protein